MSKNGLGHQGAPRGATPYALFEKKKLELELLFEFVSMALVPKNCSEMAFELASIANVLSKVRKNGKGRCQKHTYHGSMAHGSRLMAQGSWLKAHGSWPGPGPLRQILLGHVS